MKQEILRVKLGKVLYCLSGWLMPIKTYQRTYEWMGPNLDAENEDAIWENKEFEYAGRVWMPCHLAFVVLEWSSRVDPDHFDHWALEHIPGDICQGHECPTCGGHVHATPADTRVNLNGEV